MLYPEGFQSGRPALAVHPDTQGSLAWAPVGARTAGWIIAIPDATGFSQVILHARDSGPPAGAADPGKASLADS
ncbi:hypothetical protein GCM10009818_10960 [Nakamurella flavida]